MGHIIADIHPLQKPPKPLILKFRKISHRILRRCHCRTLIGADMSCYLFLESITGFHRPSRSSRGLFIGCNSHICSQACGISIQIKLPPAMVTPVPVIILIPAVPYPVFPPPWSPHTPGCRGYFCIGRNRRSCKLVIPVIRIGIWRWIFIQIHNLDVKSSFTCSSSAPHTDGHRHSLRLLRCCPADPSQLTVAGRIIYLPYLIASSLYGKCYGYRMIRITLPAAYLYCRNHFRIRPIFIIISRDFRFFWRHIPEPYNTKTQGTLYFTVGTDSRCRTSPGRISQIRCFQKHGKRQVLKCHCWKDSTKPTT